MGVGGFRCVRGRQRGTCGILRFRCKSVGCGSLSSAGRAAASFAGDSRPERAGNHSARHAPVSRDAGTFNLNNTRLWILCYAYANELKAIRKFHDIKGGCDSARRAALLSRLIAQHRPIEYNAGVTSLRVDEKCDQYHYINATLAVYVMFFFTASNKCLESRSPIIKKVVAELKFIFSQGHGKSSLLL